HEVKKQNPKHPMTRSGDFVIGSLGDELCNHESEKLHTLIRPIRLIRSIRVLALFLPLSPCSLFGTAVPRKLIWTSLQHAASLLEWARLLHSVPSRRLKSLFDRGKLLYAG